MKKCPQCGSEMSIKTFRSRKAYARRWAEYLAYDCTAKDCMFSIRVSDYEAIRAGALQEAYSDIAKLNQMAVTSLNDDYLIGYGFGVRDCQIKIEAILNKEAEK